jgi:hypothetical protein
MSMIFSAGPNGALLEDYAYYHCQLPTTLADKVYCRLQILTSTCIDDHENDARKDAKEFDGTSNAFNPAIPLLESIRLSDRVSGKCTDLHTQCVDYEKGQWNCDIENDGTPGLMGDPVLGEVGRSDEKGYEYG